MYRKEIILQENERFVLCEIRMVGNLFLVYEVFEKIEDYDDRKLCFGSYKKSQAQREFDRLTKKYCTKSAEKKKDDDKKSPFIQLDLF